MNNSARSRRIAVSADGPGRVSQAEAVLLGETMRVTGLGRGLSAALQQWRAPQALHDPGRSWRTWRRRWRWARPPGDASSWLGYKLHVIETCDDPPPAHLPVRRCGRRR